MYRFLHTADWQIGMRAAGLDPAAASRVRAARVSALRNVTAAAAAHGADAILVAGDLFEDNAVDPALVEQVAAVLNDATACPVYLIPGNHDPDTLDGVWRRPVWRQLRGHVRPLLTADPVPVADGVTLYPCPLSAKHGREDPTAWIPHRADGDATLRIGLAHGTMRIRPDVGDDDFPVPPDAADRLGLDYLALGHWHSVLSNATRRAWYSGTHEQTKFGERDSGRALLVTLTAAGVPPQVEPVDTGTLRWADHGVDLDAGPADDALRHLREWPDADRCLVRVAVSGRQSPATAAAVAAMRAVLAERFLHHSCDDHRLRPADAASALDGLAGGPHLTAAAEELAAAAATDPVAARALELLHECAWAARVS